ncbi:MAG TPA: hypothetical protein VJR46_07220 [Candidatus Dormibacteraeota bacterium]|nr:hypothetical protein [Candidatus Dormibacteraeota bacterium]
MLTETTYDVRRLLSMSKSEIDDLFRRSPAGDIPAGEAVGTAIISPGTRLSSPAAKFVHIFAWHGKVFDPVTGTLKNKILPVATRAIVARVYKAPSWLDEKECIVLDYSKTSLVAHHVRDEIRLVAPGTYLGIVFWKRARLIAFALQFK